MRRHTAGMRRYWDERAHLNAAFYVDTDLDYDAPDMAQFLATGQRVVAVALDEPPAVRPAETSLAVEIGCGMGRICLALADRFDHVVGVDIAREMLRRAGELVDDERVEFRLTDGVSLPDVPDASADLVLTFTVFQHVPSVSVIRAYVAEAARVLRPDGVFVLQWNSSDGTARWRVRRALKVLAQRLGRGDRYGRDVPQFLGSAMTVPDMDATLRAAGLTRVASTGEGTLFTWAWARRTDTAG
ncbi:MAG TPA: class I SAM-dependent methyltransferase [Mycobacteriales bacterium]|nr:class I SAM-dependent methyltransferase [Mycobacteriales bacterium]